ncbi:type II toxin-antitoxin system PemK/MazF family toxin [Lamprobacter modestohalophilus]|uniref:type II toxin-antitoxin system PemK/MazF family toxin n=1 Tax=Lamprobacter modestohalophilus TaxID=1064514 RepID=UPI002ADED143|nr:type II toxin-antitoxin system PemK/MazF family toxin [Lamprobacter modestohalophilus]MEA1051578.1 type II toxin-antitoxin system PemK/MazF family toxin [Lamprobacter modestohalophilus]
MAKILRGEIRWADLNPTIGREQSGERPVLILSQDIFNERSGTVIAMALTSQEQRAGFPLTHEVLAPRLPTRSWVKRVADRILAAQGQAAVYTTAEGFASVATGEPLQR